MNIKQMTKTKKILTLGLLWVSPFYASAEIVFNGMNSYSTYKGMPEKLSPVSDKGLGSNVLLQEVAPGQIDYTKGGATENRTDLDSSRGMIIEAEGCQSFARNLPDDNASGYIVSNPAYGRGNQYSLACARKARFSFPVQVKKSGVYTFTLDGAFGADAARSVLSMYTSSDLGTTIQPAGDWTIEYKTGEWTGIKENIGGNSAATPYTVDIYLTTDVNTLVFEYLTDRAINMDCFRVINYDETDKAPRKKGEVPLPIILAVVIGMPAAILATLYFTCMRNKQ